MTHEFRSFIRDLFKGENVTSIWGIKGSLGRSWWKEFLFIKGLGLWECRNDEYIGSVTIAPLGTLFHKWMKSFPESGHDKSVGLFDLQYHQQLWCLPNWSWSQQNMTWMFSLDSHGRWATISLDESIACCTHWPMSSVFTVGNLDKDSGLRLFRASTYHERSSITENPSFL